MRRLCLPSLSHSLFVCILFFHQIIMISPATETQILLQFKNTITEDPFNSLRNWVSGENPCQNYNGVFCDSAGFVEKIVLWNTGLAGVLSPALAGLKSLRTLTLFGNRFSGNIPDEYGDIQTLRNINLSSNSLSGSIPEFLGDLANIRFLDLSRNGFSGNIPSALFKHCYKTRYISLSHNSLSGVIPPSIVNCLNLEGFDFSYNNISGGIPSQICDIPGLRYVFVRGNMLSGSVEAPLLSCQSLNLLDLGSNFFTGSAPFSVLSSQNITYFNLSNNGFVGSIQVMSNCGDRMEIFDVSSNDFVGEIPSSISKCQNLKIMDLGYNKLSGTIPVEITDLKRLLVIRLGNNSIGGSIPANLGNIEVLQILDLHNLNLNGEIPSSLGSCRFLLELDISSNYLYGEIPESLYNMTYLEILDIHHNRLNGSIPQSLGTLSKLQTLDLSENFLSGSIPSSLGYLTMLRNFNVSFNNLSGSIPAIISLQGFRPSSFSNNPFLCGAPLDSCSANVGITTSKKSKVLSPSAIVAIVAAILILTGVCVISVMNIMARRRKKEREATVIESTPLGSTDSSIIIGKLVLFSKSLPSKYEDWEAGTKALLDKECLIGGGSIGTVYRTDFEGGISIAVKKLETLGRIRNQEEFEQEIGRLGSVRHPNLVVFQGYYWSSTMQLILSEFLPNGNLYENLHGQNFAGTSTSAGNIELYWSRRFQIAVGTARALDYLHHDCKPAILHLNIKSTNILLDENYEAKLSDYGLGKLLPILDNNVLTKFHTSVGYVAPELAQSSRLSEKCDVYSYGVILLELVTGRKPVESSRTNEVVILCEFVREYLERGSPSDCFDPNLRGFEVNELVQVMKLGLICSSEVASKRPSMAEVVQVLESIRNGMGSYEELK